jgi:ABC-type transport system involved in multi-copper enzyme maturation permease subunit
MQLITLASLTLREASRRKLLVVVGALTVVLIPLVAWGFTFIPGMCSQGCGRGGTRAAEASILILVAYMFSFIIAVAAPFIAAPAISGDVESHVILGILPRPIRRRDVVMGRWLGLAILLAGYTILTCGLEFFAVRVSVGYVPPHPILATLAITGEAISLMTLSLLGSTRLSAMTCGIAAVILFGVTWIVGVAGQIGAAFGNSVLADVGTASSMVLPTDGLWRAAVFNMEPVGLLAASGGDRAGSADPFFVSAPPTTAYVIWAIVWIAVMLAFAVWSFQRREV